MSWLANLHETYNNISALPNKKHLLWPISHFVKIAHVEIVLDGQGSIKKGRCKILTDEESSTLIPATDFSAGRTSGIAPHPLCDEISYCAIDWPKTNTKKVKSYLDLLQKWKESQHSHPKLFAIWNYLQKQQLWHDLCEEIELPVKRTKIKDGKKETQRIEDGKIFIRWRVEEKGNPMSGTWEDEGLIQAWIQFYKSENGGENFCYLLGKDSMRISNHSRFLRSSKDGAKIISSNDHSGFTFRGRFTDSKTIIDKKGTQAVGVSYEVSQKAHNALRWLISNQGYRNNDQVYVAWAVSCEKLPSPLKNAWELFNDDSFELQEAEPEPKETQKKLDYNVDLGDSFAQKFKRYLAGYGKLLEVNEQIVVMGIDSATPGRMSIIYYRELLASEFLERVEKWHNEFAWPQRYTKKVEEKNSKKKPKKNKTIWPISTPSPKRIVDAAYGDIIKKNETLYKSVVERILPCIIDGQPFPRDIVVAAVHKSCNRNNIEWWEWEQNLGTTCALYRGYYKRHPKPEKKRDYSMSLEKRNTSRDYLFGRLLAVAERIEETALRVADENRPTNAARMMQRFADRPYSTWRNIELSLQPYMQRLQNSRAGFLVNRQKELNEIMDMFEQGSFTLDDPLKGEFLLGYHCQKQYWRATTKESNDTNEQENGENS